MEGSGGAARRRPKLRPLAFLVPYALRYKGRLALAFVFLVVAAGATLTLPVAVRRMIDEGFAAENAAFIDRYFLALVIVAGVLALASALRYFFVTALGERVVADLRSDVFRHVVRLSPAFFDRNMSGEIVSRLTADTTQVKSAVSTSVSIALRHFVLFAGAAVMMVVTSPWLSALALSVIPMVVLPLVAFGRIVRRKSRQAQDTIAEASSFATEAIGEVRTIQAFTMEARAAGRYHDAVNRAYGCAKASIAARSALIGVIIFLTFACIVGVLWLGAMEVLAGDLTAGELGQFVLYAAFAAGALGELSQVWGELALAAGSAERLSELMGEKPTVEEPARPRPLPEPARGEVRFEDVAFAYPTGDVASVLKGVSFSLSAGETAAIVGPSGAGKSTIFNLLLRFYDPLAGRVSIDGVDLREAALADVRGRIALVPQDATVFATTIRENIRLGRMDATDAEVERAAEAAAVTHFVREFPSGFETMVGERGVTLSGGQRQRLAIARALLKDAPILLLDEATSSLDAESERVIQDALARLMRGRTTIVIAHRLATVTKADRIIVLDRGAIVEEGTHRELVRDSGLYARLARLQFDRRIDEADLPPAATAYERDAAE